MSAGPTPAPAGLLVASTGATWRRVCASDALEEGGHGHRFEVPEGDGRAPAFVVRFDGEPRAYLNRCAHVPVELDWMEGRFFDDSGLYLICATHGAMYDAGTGACAGGPCRGRGLVALRACEAGGSVWVEMAVEHS